MSQTTQKSVPVLVAISLVLLGQAAQAQTPRTSWGDPDLQGRWSNATLTPLERPEALGDKAYFTAEEAREWVRETLRAQNPDLNIEADREDGETGSYNNAFFDRGNDVVPTLRTSLVIEPEDGRLPEFTPEAQRQHERNLAYAREHPADRAEDRFLSERCIAFGSGPAPMFPDPYNSNYEIVQTPDYVTILAELNHEVRIIPIDGRPHFPEHVRQWVGDSRGHWEGETLVVETTNQRPSTSLYGVLMLNSVVSDEFRVVERFTRTGPDQIRYRATVHDPAVFIEPWTIENFMYPQEGRLVEFACHEGNYGLPGLLSAAREEERRNEAAAGEQ